MPKKVLVVDNHPVILKFMDGLLAKRGYEVATAPDGLSALETLKVFSPDIVFLDLVMPNINGEKLCRMMRRAPALSDAYIIILSAIAAEGRFDHTAFGADSCIAKGPLQTMAGHVSALLDRYENAGRPPSDRRIIGCEGLKERTIIKELLSVKRHFEAVLNHLSEGILEITAEEKIVYANPAAAIMIGVQEEDLLGTALRDQFSEPHRGKLNGLLQGREAGRDFPSYDPTMVLGGKLILPDVVRLQENKGKSTIVILRDVTQQKLMEAKLFESQKMEAIGTLAGGIAHQFNNALAVILGNMEFLKMAYPHMQEGSRYLEPMLESVQRMAQLNDHLLAYARGGRYQPRLVSLADFIKDSLPLIQHTMGPAAHLETDLQDCDAYVNIDTSQMQMVVSALLSNASEALEGQGRIRLVCRSVEIAQEGVPGAFPLSPGAYACLAVEDNGRGMDEETRKRIFEPFFTTKFQGRGMGMSAVYGIVRNHGGWISVDSSLGGGSVVSIFLPSAQPERQEPEPKAAEKALTGRTLLLIEDEPMVLQVNRILLESLGYRVLPSATGKEALRLASSHKGSIDLAIIDIVLPDMEAQELFSLLMNARPGLKVIVCSGHSGQGPARKLLDLGAQGFLQKPFTLGRLSAILKEVLGDKGEAGNKE